MALARVNCSRIKPRNVFVHHDGAIGDTLLSLRCMAFIRESAIHLHLAGRTDVVYFMKEAGIADDVSSADSSFYCQLYTEALDKTIITFLSGFDRSFIFTNKADSQLIRNIKSIIPDSRVILTVPPEDSSEHAAEFRIKQCVYDEETAPTQRKVEILIRDEERLWSAEFLRERGYAAAEHCLIMVHPGSGGKTKNWSLENFSALIRRFIARPSVFCVVCTGPAEGAAVSGQLLFDRRVISLHNESLMRVAAVMSLSDFYVGNDSGISHLAGIMGCRGAVLFGPTDPSIWRPQGNTLDVVSFSGSGAEAISEIISRFNNVISMTRRLSAVIA